MATLEQLEKALRNADAAGDVPAAKRLASEIVRMRGSAGQAEPQKPSFTQQALDLAQSMTPFGMAKEAYNAVKDPQQAFQTADDSMRLLASGGSFGFADKLAGYMSGEGTEAERVKTNASRDRQGLRGVATEALGSIVPVSAITKAGVTAMNLPGWTGKILGPGIDGAAYGTLFAAGNDQDIAKGAGIGAGFGVLGQAVGAGVKKGYQAFNKPAVPSLDDLVTQKNAAYGTVDASGAQYTPQQLAGLKQGIADDMAAGRMHPAINPKVSAVNDIIADDLAKGPMTISDLDRTRQVVGNKVFQNAPTADDARLGGQMLQNFDEFIDATPPWVGGDNTAAVAALKKARELNRRVEKTRLIEEALTKADRQAAVTGSGGNIDNATRQKFNSILNNKRLSRNFTTEEKAMMDRLARGTEVGNKLRLAGKLSPQGSGLMAALGIGGAMTNPILGIPALVGIGAKAGADRTTRKMADALLNSVKTGGAYKVPDMPPAAKAKLDAMIKALVVSGTAGAVTQGN
jgi:hypothetical protein